MTHKCVIAINEVDFGSTGNITFSILNYLKEKGFETYFACHELTKNLDNEFQISIGKFNYLYNKVLSRINASDGFHSKLSTKRLIKFLDEKKPSLLLLGNLHGSYLNLPILFKYIKANNIKCIYTLHDCWSFTGKCAHFNAVGCDKWKTQCYKCPNLHTHPRAHIKDISKKLYFKKKLLFSNLRDNITIVAPSQWLCDVAKQSYLKEYEIIKINNGIAHNVNIKKIERLDLVSEKRIVLLFVGSPLNEMKGAYYLNRLGDELDPNKYLLIAVGVPQNLRNSRNVRYLDFIKSREEMNYLYESADYFVAPTLDDTFPSTNVESLMMGTQIIGFDVGGNTEVINNKTGFKILYKSYDNLKSIILSLNKKTKESSDECKEYSIKYSVEVMQEAYYKLICEKLDIC